MNIYFTDLVTVEKLSCFPVVEVSIEVPRSEFSLLATVMSQPPKPRFSTNSVDGRRYSSASHTLIATMLT